MGLVLGAACDGVSLIALMVSYIRSREARTHEKPAGNEARPTTVSTPSNHLSQPRTLLAPLRRLPPSAPKICRKARYIPQALLPYNRRPGPLDDGPRRQHLGVPKGLIQPDSLAQRRPRPRHNVCTPPLASLASSWQHKGPPKKSSPGVAPIPRLPAPLQAWSQQLARAHRAGRTRGDCVTSPGARVF